jgi:hypothetical protein
MNLSCSSGVRRRLSPSADRRYPADDVADNPLVILGCWFCFTHELPPAKDNRSMSDLRDLLEVVRNQDHCHALIGQALDET